MLFSSLEFLLFFPLIFLLAQVSRGRGRTLVLLAASYLFYASWDWRFLALLALTTLSSFFIAQRIEDSKQGRQRKQWLLLSTVLNLGVLFLFKYFDFFTDGASQIMSSLGMRADFPTLQVILPLGISFYTFQTISYTVDVYRKKVSAEKDLPVFALYVAYFPQLIAGPIERASRLLPQLRKPAPLSLKNAETAVFLLLSGYFKKVAIADNLAPISDEVFSGGAQSAPEILLGVLAFSGQIYADFSGYTDIARGLSLLLGIRLVVNFRLPYLAKTPSEFWQRWHVSLSAWFRDYVYIPLGGNRGGRARTAVNLLITMILAGLWHGAAVNFLLWGLYHGLLLMGYRFLGIDRQDIPRSKGMTRILMIVPMLMFTGYGWLIFRAVGPGEVLRLTKTLTIWDGVLPAHSIPCLLLILPLALSHLVHGWRGDLLLARGLPAPVRGVLYAILLALTLALGRPAASDFIYFQF